MNERDETFWINACLHLILCNKADGPNGCCEKCMAIKKAVEEDKADVVDDYTWTEVNCG